MVASAGRGCPAGACAAGSGGRGAWPGWPARPVRLPAVSDLVSIDAIRDAAERLKGVVQRTPLEPSRAVSEMAAVRTLLKCEHLQRTGSFKIRGAFNRVSRLDDDAKARGVVCASAGNHAQGVALSAQLAGARARVYMPAGAPLPKVAATRAYGADVVLVGDTFDEAYEASQEWTAAHGATYVHPFDHADVIAGQGTLGVEILEEVPDAGTVVPPGGGGGLVWGRAGGGRPGGGARGPTARLSLGLRGGRHRADRPRGRHDQPRLQWGRTPAGIHP
jgi:hypothetical protein